MKHPTLALFDPERPTTVSADASSYGLGAALLQKQACGENRPVAYMSRYLSPTEQQYAQIEKEALALTRACERFTNYLIGLHFHVETDHKPVQLQTLRRATATSSKISDEDDEIQF